ncbi:DUF1707 SHOCT-like domain-containing protein [Compostimonas suwonensis]|uniref:Uncharacterized protein DUF1707 n=1 Tax=Compostimonas suwonensis TaxID=1048394 RepID=A0A2M9C3N7_9MICO|nr:DUF1707 domain-containing protein [Compostimonas suwonensis]PJJ65067.1 uncharacterized protein DUF1707 [Compostimonas suwonensis]
MTSDSASTGGAELRLSNAERDEAVARLSEQLGAGRITTDEYTQRSAAARQAVTRGDLEPLFADLPVPPLAPAASATPAPAPPPPYAGAAVPPYGAPASDDGYGDRRGGRAPWGGRGGVVVVSIIPFVALALFLLTGYAGGWAWSWLWFLLVPVAGIVVYGFGSDRDRGRDR